MENDKNSDEMRNESDDVSGHASERRCVLCLLTKDSMLILSVLC